MERNLFLTEEILTDERLNVTELGIMTKLLSMGFGYKFKATKFRNKIGLGYQTYQKCLQHLQELGYLEKYFDGKKWNWNINDTPKN